MLANRLSENPAHRVLLIEAGGSDWNPWLHIPVGYFKTMHNPAFDWCYLTEPDQGIAGRQLQWPRGKVLGGSSSLNGLLYVRGQAQDYDRWAELGNDGWSFDEVLPFFKISEDNERGARTHGAPHSLDLATLHQATAMSYGAILLSFGQPSGHSRSRRSLGWFRTVMRLGRLRRYMRRVSKLGTKGSRSTLGS